LQALCADVVPDNGRRGRADYAEPVTSNGTLMRVGNVPIYAVDALVRAAPSLQRTPLAAGLGLALHPEQAAALGLGDGDEVEVAQGEARARVRVAIDDAVAMGVGRVPAAVPGSERLGPQIGPMTVEKI
jgi:NADH-quinone oxidoreductase subunit G